MELDAVTRGLLEAGYGTIVGLVGADGTPFATRGWGSVVLHGEPLRLRVCVGAGAFTRAGLGLGDAGFAIAVNTGDLHTLQNIQVKGTALLVAEPDDADLAVADAHREGFLDTVETIDGLPRHLMQRMVPTDLWVCELEVADVFDQTPGPGAGGRIPT